MADDDNIPKKLAKKTQPKRVSFGLGTKAQISISSQENKEVSFILSLLPSSNVANLSRIALKDSEPSCFHLYSDKVEPSELELHSLISPCRR